jgi:hypothetical protein
MLLGKLNMYMISLMNSIALAAMIEVAGFTSIHFVNLSNANEDMYKYPFSFLKRTYQINPPC